MRKIKEGIRSDSLSLSTYYLRLIFKQDEHETEIATGTGFMYQHNDYLYLITNGHNVTGVNPETSERIASHAGIPNLIKSKARIRSADNPNMVGTNFFDIDLYEDPIHMDKPKWFIHPVHG